MARGVLPDWSKRILVARVWRAMSRWYLRVPSAFTALAVSRMKPRGLLRLDVSASMASGIWYTSVFWSRSRSSLFKSERRALPRLVTVLIRVLKRPFLRRTCQQTLESYRGGGGGSGGGIMEKNKKKEYTYSSHGRSS